ncbi:hypothetical protein CRUP_034601 [Coryphaenoides rupestris]|nr:hypothetical protein CRUP_034601 [Coryphaenoides rupestris]
MSAPAEESAVKVEESEAAETSEPVQLYWKADGKSIHQIDDGTPTKSFSYGTIFAYGQTSSGKTFTMMGSDLAPGVIPLSMEEVFQTIKNFPKKEFLLRVSYLEIYNETVTDLLVDSWKRKPLEVREALNANETFHTVSSDLQKNIYVADLTEELVTSPAQALAWIRKGEKNRHYGKTKMNQRSSRSHTIFRMILESRERSDPSSGENSDGAIIVSHLNLVDLAGSERASQTGAEGARFKEGCNINRSLFTLAQVIKKLSDESQRGFTNYRDSKLTRILQNSLGGNAKTVIICTITPSTLEETLSTLQFASTAKKMKNDPHVTEVSDDGALLKRYRNEIIDLKRRLQEVSSGTQTTATEKQTLSQILQEKDQLQKEQEDRIRNLTRLLDEEFESGWEVPGECFYDMERNSRPQSVSPSGSGEKEGKLELQLEEERSLREEVLSRASSLEQQVEVLAREKREAWEEVERAEQRAEEQEVQLSSQAQEKMEAQEKVEMLEIRLADLEEQNRITAGPHEQMKKEFEEAIQLCETLVSEKEAVSAERVLLLTQVSSLEKEKGFLSQELQERMEEQEFMALEVDCGKEAQVRKL